MPEPYPVVPSCSAVARAARRGLLLAGTALALTGASASAATAGGAQAGAPGGGAEAGNPAVARQAAATPARVALPVKLSRAAIRTVQRKLKLKADGVLGPRTRAAVRRLQRRKGLKVNGRLTPETLAALGIAGRAASVPPAPPSAEALRLLAAIAQCESGGDPTKVSPGGKHRGKYQFLISTWKSVGGTGDPAAAPEAEQDLRAAALLAAQGTKPWPVCGKQAQAAQS